MPELPELETVARQLAGPVAGQRLRDVRVLDDRLDFADTVAQVRGRVVVDVRRIGKQVAFVLGPSPRRVLCVHLRMTGRLLWDTETEPPEPRHLRAVLSLDRGRVLFYDARRFGTMQLFPTVRAASPAGLEPLSGRFTARALAELLHASTQGLKSWLLRQDRLVGLGNIYASEILFAARLHPERPAGSLDPHELRRLHRATRRVLRQAIDCCGTTFSDYRTSWGVRGGFQEFLGVYARAGEPCRRCGQLVERVTIQGRSTFWCPRCQPSGAPTDS